MKKQFLVLALAAVPAFAFAAPNTINFQGEVTDQTCQVSVNGNPGNPTVLLPTVPATALSGAGSTAGQTTFTVAVSDCMAPVSTTQAINTVFVGNLVTTAGNLGNTGTATNVALQLLDPAGGAPFDLTAAGGVYAPGLELQADETAAAHDFAVQYISETGAATAGTVLGSVQYSVSYQ
ncbi:fimbrial protein [Paraburkholderia dinghuensis]|uniref:Type 1 fimbrial protein n=1 Tax=Paraburkholderia dinghuensis TaxID=2305225 RepID=A0A3N6PS10_9BURK|nr:fimbrial protein [Paraburkholderia dinghuensis]RQH04730.1 type 1 fimbrial protein [Paraburkholderia dinghuensis]